MRIASITMLVGCSVASHTVAPDADRGDAVGSDASPPPLVDAAVAADAAPAPSPSRQLAIQSRQQWENGDGYCGEMSIQSIALYDGAWISEQVVRNLAGGELLLGVNEQTALTKLHLDFVEWTSSAPSPQAESFLAWIKTELQQGVPVIYAVYLTDGANDPDYDHIVPAIGIDATTFGGYVATDQLTSNNNFGMQIVASMSALPATRQGCAKNLAHGGCVPRDVDYGVAVSGITDVQHVTLPATLTVPGTSEPNVSLGASPSQLTGTVTVSGLTAGQSYTLLRYDDYRKVPTNATAAQFLTSQFTHRTDFVATGATWTYVDPVTFSSSGTTYYRAIPL